MLRHSPLPPLVLGSALALGIALTDARTDATFETARARPTPGAPVVRTGAAPSPGEAVTSEARRLGPRRHRRAL